MKKYIIIIVFMFLAYPQVASAQIKDIFNFDRKSEMQKVNQMIDEQGEQMRQEAALKKPPPKNPFKAQLPDKPPDTEVVKSKPKPKPQRRVPTRPPGYPQHRQKPVMRAKPPDVRVTGIIWNSSRPQAIINNQVLDIGDRVSNATVEDIEKGSVTMRYGGKQFKILYGEK